MRAGRKFSLRSYSTQSVLLLALFSVGCSSSSAPPAVSPSAVSEGAPSKKGPGFTLQARAALSEGEYEKAEELLRNAVREGDVAALLELATLLLLQGRHEEVEELLAKSPLEGAALLRAQGLISVGKLAEAEAVLLQSAKDGGTVLEQLERELLLGKLAIEQGQRGAGEERLKPLFHRVSTGAVELQEPEQRLRAWTLAGEAAVLMRYFEDANDAFDEAEQQSKADLQLLLLRGRLFLQKHDLAHAAQILKEAEKLAPHHPDTLIFSARFKLERSLSFDEAAELCERVLAINPRSTAAREILAGIELRDLNLGAAASFLKEGLKVNPRDLSLLSQRAALEFLREDPTAFEETVEEVLKLSPGYTRLFVIVGEHAQWEHRYPDIERLMRRATRLDSEDGDVRALLGLTLVRAQSDAAGVVELGRSFDLDPFNLRVFNTLDLYEKIIPRDYLSLRRGPFRYRFPKNEAALLERYVPALLDKAYAQMVERYDYVPAAPIDIELYATREQFAVRTSGLPRTAIQGVCFGRKLATISPMGSPGNLGMTLWHELAHVFHIGLSKNRVPRWLTEGLAEWETARRGVGWSRELDLSLLQAKNNQSLPKLAQMSRAFTRAKTHRDVATAYYASSKIADWIVASRGQKSAVALLSTLGEKRLAQDVVPEVLGASFSSLDLEFRRWLSEDLNRFDAQFVSKVERRPSEEIRKLKREASTEARLTLALGLSLLSEGDLKAAHHELTNHLKRWPLSKGKQASEDSSAQAVFALARLELAEERKKSALVHIESLLSVGFDGFELRMVLARVLLAQKKPSLAEPHLLAAARFDEKDATPWGLLAALRHSRGETQEELEAVRHLARIEEHDAQIHRRLIELLLSQKKFKEAVAAAELAIWTDLAGTETHRLAALAFSGAGKAKQADFEWESAWLTPATARQREKLVASWQEELRKAGRHQEAARVKSRIQDMGASSETTE